MKETVASLIRQVDQLLELRQVLTLGLRVRCLAPQYLRKIMILQVCEQFPKDATHDVCQLNADFALRVGKAVVDVDVSIKKRELTQLGFDLIFPIKDMVRMRVSVNTVQKVV
jgi:hypothetical protein